MRRTAAVRPRAIKPSAGQGSAWIPWQRHEWAHGDALSGVGAELAAEARRTPLQGDVPVHRHCRPFGHRPPTPEEPLPSDSQFSHPPAPRSRVCVWGWMLIFP